MPNLPHDLTRCADPRDCPLLSVCRRATDRGGDRAPYVDLERETPGCRCRYYIAPTNNANAFTLGAS